VANEVLPPWEEAKKTSSPPPPWEEARNALPPPWEEAQASASTSTQGSLPPPWEEAQGSPPIDTSLDQPSPLDRQGKFLSNVYSPQAAIGSALLNVANKTASGLNRTIISSLRGIPELAEVIQNTGADEPFQPTWKAPVSSMLVGVNKLLKKLEDEVTLPPDPNAAWYEQLPEAFGSAVGFMGLGWAAGAAGFTPTLASAALGGAAGAVDQYDDAIAHGATPEQAAIAYAGGAAFGLTEAVPGGIFLNKLNQLTKGKVYEAIKAYNLSGETGVTLETVKGFFTEAIQEGVQTIGSNWVASDLAGYDPTRTLGENFWESVVTGGVVGSFIGGGLALIRKGQRNEILAALEAERRAKLASNDPINFIEGQFTPVGDLVRLRGIHEELRQRLEERKETAHQEFLVPKEGTDIIPYSFQEPRHVGYDAEADKDKALALTLLDKKVSPIEKALPKAQDGSSITVREALEITPVVAVDANPYDELIKTITTNIDKISKLPTEGLSPSALKKRQRTLELLKGRRIDLIAKQQIADNLLAQVKSYAAVFTKVLNPDLKLIVTDVPTVKEKLAGFFQLTNNYKMLNGKSVPLGLLYVDVDELATQIYLDKKAKTNEHTHRARRRLFETLNHELGHSIATNLIAQIFRDYESPDQKIKEDAIKLSAVLLEEYQRWLEKAAQSPQAFLLLTQFAPQRAISAAKSEGAENINLTPMTAPLPASWASKEYLLSFDEFFAEMTARLATQESFSDEVMTRYFKPVIAQYKAMFEHMPPFVKSEYGNDWKLFLETRKFAYKVNAELERVAAAGGSDIIKVLRYGLNDFDEKFAGLQEHLDKFDKIISVGFNLLQIVKENPHIPHLQRYLQAVTNWAEYQRNFQADAVDTLKAWKNLGKVEAAQLADVLYEEALNKKRFIEDELARRLTNEALDVYKQVRGQLDRVLEEMRTTALTDAARTIIDSEEQLKQEIAGINADFDKLKAQGYFPFMRFGNHTITARAKRDFNHKGVNYKKGQLISFEAYESVKERDLALGELRKELGVNAVVASGKMRETDFVVQGMPRALLRSLRGKLEATKNFTPEQAAAFERWEAQVAPFRSFRKHLLRKRGIHGYSEDAIRSFAYYIRSGAGHIARVKFADDLHDPIQSMQQDVAIIQEYGGRSDERQEMRHWLDRHFSYIMNPDNEWAVLRSVGFVAYLGFNVKSAVVNGMQILTTVAPYLAARYGDVKAISALTKATWTLRDWVANRQKFLNAMDSAQDKLKAKLRYALRIGKIEGGAAHFTLDFGEDSLFEEFLSDVGGEVDAYDLSKLKVAPNTLEVRKLILQKTLELEQAGNRGNLQSGSGELFGTRELLAPEEIVSEITMMLESNNIPPFDPQMAEELGLYRGALALGYDAMLIMESGDDINSTTLSVFNNTNKIKKIDKKTFERNRNASQARENLRENRIARLIERGKHEGWLDQSLATEIAIAASENNLDRGLYLPKVRRFWHEVSRFSALPFHLVEKMNRYITAIAAYELEFAESGSHEKGVLAARQANWTANYENARWNRPEFMRGKKSVFFLFANYLQNTLYFATHDPGALRYWLMMMLLGGLMGLPGAEDVADLVDFTATYFSRILGIKEPKTQIRRELREHLEELGANPDLILHGISQSTFGLAHVGELTGIPIPHLDLSRSVGMGDVVPLTEVPSMFLQSEPNDILVAAARSAAGASGNLVESYYRGLLSDDPNDWKSIERILPLVAAKNLSKAARLAIEGKETTSSGDVIGSFDLGNPRDQLEILAQALGFSPARLILGWERQMAQRDMIQYYKVQQEALLRDMNWALFQEDREARADALASIRKYNEQVPLPEMKIGTQTIRDSFKSYLAKQATSALGLAAEKKYRRLREQVEKSFPDPLGNAGMAGDSAP